MNELIKAAMERGRLVILLGAGSSCTSTNSLNKKLPIGSGLVNILAEELGVKDLTNESLRDVYYYAKSTLGFENLIKIFEREFKHCKPSEEYRKLATYPFRRIYTFNIDDAFERATYHVKNLKFNVKRRNDHINDCDQLYSVIDYVKLNGDINVPGEGFIFSATEYGEGSATEPAWYKELARDFSRFTFLFIGTTLNEPLFNHQVQKYLKLTGHQSTKSYLLVPNLSIIKENSFSSSNIQYIPGDLSSFISWLESEFPNGLTATDILRLTNPSSAILEFNESSSNEQSLLDDVIAVNRTTLNLITKNPVQSQIKDFYKGFKPIWRDILDSVPAELYTTKQLYNHIVKCEYRTFIVTGPAGSGKTTALKQIALRLSETTIYQTYYIEEYQSSLSDLVSYLDKKNNKKYYICVERIAENASEISKIIKSNLSEFVVFVCAENQRIWNHRCIEYFQDIDFYTQDFSQIHESDVDELLEKIKKHGNWTRLNQMSVKKRRIEIIKKAKKQLLIGLIEATSGEGFSEIISKEYNSINENQERKLLLLASLATKSRVEGNEHTISRALKELDCLNTVKDICKNLSGVISYNNGLILARHRLFAEKILLLANEYELQKVIIAYIKSFSDYKKPVVKYISKNEAAVYKGLVNFKFLKKYLKNDKELIIQIYLLFEKSFELDGLFLMQYGLALRHSGNQMDALSKLRIARDAYPESPHIEHAFAQQLLIIAEQEASKNYALAMDYLHQAKAILDGISNLDKNKSDKYPIITLSLGHIKIMHNLGRNNEARLLAGDYHREISNKFHFNKNLDKTIKETLDNLVGYKSTGNLKYLKYLIEY